MKIKGEFVLREIAGETILVPVGQTALHLNGMISLDPVGATIWKGIDKGLDKEAILSEILDTYEVEATKAKTDMEEFLDQMSKANLLEY